MRRKLAEQRITRLQVLQNLRVAQASLDTASALEILKLHVHDLIDFLSSVVEKAVEPHAWTCCKESAVEPHGLFRKARDLQAEIQKLEKRLGVDATTTRVSESEVLPNLCSKWRKLVGYKGSERELTQVSADIKQHLDNEVHI